MVELISKYKTELSDKNIYLLLSKAKDKDKMAEILGSDNINKLSDDNVLDLFYDYDVKDKQKMAQILNQYYNKKTPEIQKEIDQ